MRIQFFIFSLVFLVSACSHQAESIVYSEKNAEALIMKALGDEPLQEEDYEQILSQLEGMFNVICDKAQMAIEDDKATKEDIRGYLISDEEYIRIQGYSHILDSVLVRYLKSPECTPNMRQKYSRVLARAYRNGAQVGLY